MSTFTDKLIDAIKEKQSILCVGLDPQVEQFPSHLQGLPRAEAIFEFNKAIIDATAPFAAAVKPQTAFYELYGSDGYDALAKTIRYAKEQGLVVIEDAKRGDGSDTVKAYAEGHLGRRQFAPVDALTVHGWIADACIDGFLPVMKENGTGIFVVTKTSFNPNSRIENLETTRGIKVWEELAQMCNEWGKGLEGEYGYSNVGVVMGATYPEDATRMRELVPNAFFLVPGYGKQGGGAEGAVMGADNSNLGIIVNSARGIMYAFRDGEFAADEKKYASAAAKAAEHARNDLNNALKARGDLPW